MEPKTRIRLNISCAGTLIALSANGAVVRLPKPQTPRRQTTLTIEDCAGDTIHIPARVVRTEPQRPAPVARPDHDVVVEFLELSQQTAAAIRRLIEGTDTVIHGRTA